MKLTLDEEQSELRQLVKDMIADSGGMRNVRDIVAAEETYNREFWAQLAESGLLGIAIPEEYGGSGASHVERSIVIEELGRGVVPTPYLAAAVMATDVLLAADDQPIRSALLEAIASGEKIVAVAVSEPGTAWPLHDLKVKAHQGEQGWALEGMKTSVVGGSDADTILVYAQTPDGPAWFVVDVHQSGVTRERMEGIDPTRVLSRIACDGAIGELLATADARAVADATRDRASVALAAEALGGHDEALRITVEYAKIRYQFGRVIGSYQAVKHGLANVYSSLELARSVIRYAAAVSAAGDEEEPLASALAYQYVPKAFQDAAFAAIHFHGGIGFTWEHDAHFYFKRAQSIASLLGSGSERTERLAERLERLEQ